jgi:hypothetical protein
MYSLVSAKIADTRGEAESQRVHQSEDVIGKARRVRVVFLDPALMQGS